MSIVTNLLNRIGITDTTTHHDVRRTATRRYNLARVKRRRAREWASVGLQETFEKNMMIRRAISETQGRLPVSR